MLEIPTKNRPWTHLKLPRQPFPVKKGSPLALTVSWIREPYSETLKSHQHLTQLKNALLLIYESHLTSESNLERLISKILSQPVPYPSSGIPTNILILLRVGNNHYFFDIILSIMLSIWYRLYPYISRPIIRYKLSTKDYQAILPPKSADIPSTGKSGLNYWPHLTLFWHLTFSGRFVNMDWTNKLIPFGAFTFNRS